MSPKVWRRTVFIKWKDTASHAEIARAFTIHKSFPRLIPAVLSVTEGMTFTSVVDGAGAYPGVAAGQQNTDGGVVIQGKPQGLAYHSAIEIILSCSTTDEIKTKYFNHPAHLAAAQHIDPLIEDAWAMDWLEDRDTLVVPSASVAVMKHLVFFEFDDKTTKEHRDALFAAWRSLPQKLPVVLAVSCDEPIRWERGDKKGYHAGLIVDLALKTSDGVKEIAEYANSDAYQKINADLLAPIRKRYTVMDFAEHRLGMGAGMTSKL